MRPLVLAAALTATILLSHARSAADDLPGTLTGTLTLAGKPAAGVTVLLAPAEVAVNIWPDAQGKLVAGTQRAVTGADGGFRFTAIAPRRWTIYVMHRGVVPHVRAVDLEAAPHQARFEAALTAATIVRGRVTGPDGRPAARVTVRVSGDPSSLDFPHPRTLTDADGLYQLGQVPAGGYWLEAYGSDGRMAATKLEVRGVGELTRDLRLSPPDDPQTLRLRIEDDAGRPMAGARVAGTGPEPHTDAAGRWRSRRYQPGSSLSLEVYPEGLPIYLPPIRTPSPQEVVFAIPSGVIEVRSPSRAEDLRVIVRGPGWRYRDRIGARQQGSVVRFEGLKPGHWSLWAHHEDHRMGQMELDLAPGAAQSVEVPLEAKGRVVRGRFVDRRGRPLVNVEVEVSCWILPLGVSTDGQRSYDDYTLGHQRVRTDARGQFLLQGLHPGRHVIFFRGREGVSRLLFVVLPAGDSGPVALGDVRPSEQEWALPLHNFAFGTPEGIVMGRPEYRRRFARSFQGGELVISIDGHALDSADHWQVLALLDGPGAHEVVLRGPHSELELACPPGAPGVRLPFRRGLHLPGMGTDYSMVVEPLPANHPWSKCLETDDLMLAVSTEPKVQLAVNGRSGDRVDAALASGLPVKVWVRRRGPEHRIRIPGRKER